MAQVIAFFKQLCADLTTSNLTPLPVTREELEAEWCRLYDRTIEIARAGLPVPADLLAAENRAYSALTLADVDRRRPA